MEEKNFSALLSVFELLEKEDLGGSNIEICIRHLLEIFSGELANEQVTTLNVEFARYYKSKKLPDI